jgi:uncharacterized protein (TIGR02246 family)
MRCAAVPPGLPPSRAADEEHVVQRLLSLATAYAAFDADAVRDAYAPEADLIDADGTALHGRDEIVEHVRQQFEKRKLAAGALVGVPALWLRWLGDDTVIAITYHERRRQRIDGRTLRTRRTHSLKVLRRREHNSWLIVSDIYADARDQDARPTEPTT